MMRPRKDYPHTYDLGMRHETSRWSGTTVLLLIGAFLLFGLFLACVWSGFVF